MVDSIVSLDSVVVSGGPSSIVVSTDFGPQGERGSLILYGTKKPQELNDTEFQEIPQLLDWYINLNPSDSEYQYIYQYRNELGLNKWVRIFKIIPNVYNTNQSLTFTNGVATTTLLVSNTTAPLLGATPTPTLNTHIDIQTSLLEPISSNFAFTGYSFNSTTQNYELGITITASKMVPPPTPDQSVQSLANMLAISSGTVATPGVDGVYTVYVVDNNTYYVFNGTGLPSVISSWTPWSIVQPLTGSATAHISINVV